jgi:putative SOS response-associated peptidase YedK
MPEPEPLPPPELFPKRPGRIVRKAESALTLDVMKWGIPRTMKGKSGKPTTSYFTNVRNLESFFSAIDAGEPALSLPRAGHRFLRMERREEPKREHWFSLLASPIFSLAGIWRPTAEGDCYPFLTCEPNPLVELIHPKATPMVLHPDDYDRWLEGEAQDACSLATSFPPQLIRWRSADAAPPSLDEAPVLH